MERELDKIQFESRREVREIIRVLEKYMETYPKENNNQAVKDLYNLLEVMDMTW